MHAYVVKEVSQGRYSRTWWVRSWPSAARLLGVTPTPRPQAMDHVGGVLEVTLRDPVPCSRAPGHGAGTRAEIDTLPLSGTYSVTRSIGK